MLAQHAVLRVVSGHGNVINSLLGGDGALVNDFLGNAPPGMVVSLDAAQLVMALCRDGNHKNTVGVKELFKLCAVGAVLVMNKRLREAERSEPSILEGTER